jgi:hypothetical protein
MKRREVKKYLFDIDQSCLGNSRAMELATLIINIVLSVLTLIVVVLTLIVAYFAWRSLLIAADNAKQSQQTLEITKRSIDLLTVDFKRRFRPLKFQVTEFDDKSPESVVITLQLTNDATQPNRVGNIRFNSQNAYMLFSAKNFKDTTIQPGVTREIKYWCSAPKDYQFVFKGETVTVAFRDEFNNEYSLEDPQRSMGVVMEGKGFYDFVWT